jgi:taurine dioxygenase
MPELIDIRPLPARLGAEVHGVALSEPFGPDTLATLHQALLHHQLLVFPGQLLNDAQHWEFSRHWGKVQLHVLDQYRHCGQPEILWITNLDANGRPKGEHPDPGATVFRSDRSWSRERGLVIFLHALRIPATGRYALHQHVRGVRGPAAGR